MTGNPFGRVRVPHHAPPPDGADRALREGTKRRRRAIVLGTGTTALAVVLVVALLPGAPGSVDLAPVTGADPTPPVETAAEALPAPPAAMVPPNPSGPSPSPAPSPFLTATPEGGLLPAEPLVTEPRDADDRPLVWRAYRFDRTYCTNGAQYVSGASSGSTTQRPGDWCSGLVGPETVSVGHPEEFGYTVCRGPAATSTMATFEMGYEVDFVVNPLSSSKPVKSSNRWSWSHGYPFTPDEPHTLTFAPGDCYTWTVTWAGERNDGTAMAAGNYRMQVWDSPNAEGLGGVGSLDIAVAR